MSSEFGREHLPPFVLYLCVSVALWLGVIFAPLPLCVLATLRLCVSQNLLEGETSGAHANYASRVQCPLRVKEFTLR
jgi:hypothetical protein